MGCTDMRAHRSPRQSGLSKATTSKARMSRGVVVRTTSSRRSEMLSHAACVDGAVCNNTPLAKMTLTAGARRSHEGAPRSRDCVAEPSSSVAKAPHPSLSRRRRQGSPTALSSPHSRRLGCAPLSAEKPSARQPMGLLPPRGVLAPWPPLPREGRRRPARPRRHSQTSLRRHASAEDVARTQSLSQDA